MFPSSLSRKQQLGKGGSLEMEEGHTQNSFQQFTYNERWAGTLGWSALISSPFMSSFVGNGLISGPLPPSRKSKTNLHKLNSTSIETIYTHIHTSTHTYTHTHIHIWLYIGTWSSIRCLFLFSAENMKQDGSGEAGPKTRHERSTENWHQSASLGNVWFNQDYGCPEEKTPGWSSRCIHIYIITYHLIHVYIYIYMYQWACVCRVRVDIYF